MKVCKKCKVEKPKTEFSIQSTTKDFLRSKCKECIKVESKEYNLNNKEKKLEYTLKNKDKLKKYRLDNRERRKERDLENISKLRKQRVDYYLKNKDKLKKYEIKNKERLTEYRKQYRINNEERLREYKKQYNLKNRKLLNKKILDRQAKDPLYKLTCSIRKAISGSIKKMNYTKKSKTFEILGCTIEGFKEHLENQFTEGMSWENRSEWHLDHIYPVSLAKSEEEIIKLNHYTNFQPLWAIDNIKKSNKI